MTITKKRIKGIRTFNSPTARQRFLTRKMTINTGLLFETTMYHLADQMIAGYNGGMWSLMEVGEHSAPAMAPEDEGLPLKVFNPISGADSEEVEPLTAGLALSVFTHHLLWERANHKGLLQATQDFHVRAMDSIKNFVSKTPDISVKQKSIFWKLID